MVNVTLITVSLGVCFQGDSGAEKPVGHIDLSVFSHCKEMTQKQTKKTTNAFMLCRTDAAPNEVVGYHVLSQ